METAPLTLDEMRLFLAAANATSQKAAARELNRSANHVNRACAAVAEFIGAKPFFTDRGVHKLTRAGRAAVDYATKVISLSDELKTVLTREENRIRVGTAPSALRVVSAASRHLPAPFEALVSENFSPVLRRQLLAGELDLFVGYDLSDIQDREAEFDKVELLSEPLFLVVPAERQRFTDLGRKLADLDNCHIADELFPAYAVANNKWLATHGLKLRARRPLKTAAEALALVSHGKHFSLLPRFFMSQAVEGVVFDQQLDTPGFEATLTAFSRPGELSPPLSLMIERLKEAFQLKASGGR